MEVGWRPSLVGVFHRGKRAKVEPSSKMELDGVAEEVLSSDHEDHGEDHVGDHVGEPAKTAGEAAAEPVTPTEALETSRPREMPPNDARDEQEPPEVLGKRRMRRCPVWKRLTSLSTGHLEVQFALVKHYKEIRQLHAVATCGFA